MYDINTIPKYEEFKFWFTRLSDTDWSVTNEDDPEFSKLYTDGDADDNAEMLQDFEKFKARPEYLIGKPLNIAEMSMDTMIDVYEKLLAGSLLLRGYESKGDPDMGITRAAAMLDWLRTTDMYRAPASTQYHDSVPGGLLKHSLTVYNNAMELHKVPKFYSPKVHSITLVALVHDWCKIGLYESYNRNVKNEATGKWEQVTAYRSNQTGIPLGHGVTSMFLASKFVKLTSEEALAIRWHMHRWNVCREEFNEFQKANEKCPLVHLIQFADELSITSY